VKNRQWRNAQREDGNKEKGTTTQTILKQKTKTRLEDFQGQKMHWVKLRERKNQNAWKWGKSTLVCFKGNRFTFQ